MEEGKKTPENNLILTNVRILGALKKGRFSFTTLFGVLEI